MASSYQQLFGVRNLSGLVEAFGKEEQLDSMFQALFMRGGTETSESDEADWDEVQLARHLAPARGAQGDWPSSQGTVTINRKSECMHVKDSTFILGAKLFKERAAGELTANAEAKVRRELRNLVKKIRKTIEYASAHSLNGSLVVNTTNVPGSSQAFTVTYGVNTYAASADWKTASTAVVSSELPAAKRDFVQTSGLQPARIICDGTITAALAANTEAQALMSDATKDAMLRASSEFQGAQFENLRLGGLQWLANEAGYVPEGGSFTKYIPATDDAFMLPGDEDLPDVLAMHLGRGIVPGSLSGPAEAGADLVMPAPTYGFYAYAERSVHPKAPGIHLNVGWVGLPVVQFPSGVCVLDVTP